MAKGIKTGGRNKGTPNKVTSETRNIIHSILTEELPNLRTYISEIEKPEIRAKLLIDLLPFIVPKYQNLSIQPGEGEEEKEMTIKVVYEDRENPR